MKKYLKFIILWATDTLDWELLYREITKYEVPGKKGWSEPEQGVSWTRIVFHYKEKNTGIRKRLVCTSNSAKKPA